MVIDKGIEWDFHFKNLDMLYEYLYLNNYHINENYVVTIIHEQKSSRLTINFINEPILIEVIIDKDYNIIKLIPTLIPDYAIYKRNKNIEKLLHI